MTDVYLKKERPVTAIQCLMLTTLLLSVSAMLGAHVPEVHAASLEEGSGVAASPHIRVEDDRLARLLDHGKQRSILLQALIDRLESSDVVVYLRCDRQLRRGVSGRLSYVSTSGSLRYVLVRVGYVGDRRRQIALVGHELRHAVEVAETPEIVDSGSLQAAYERIGYVNRAASFAGTLAFESDQAVQAGEQIFRELHDGTD